MSDDEPIDLDDFDAPDRPDFRRIGRGIPYPVAPDSDKRIRYSRSSKSGNILDDESNLTDWKLRTVVVGAAQRPELMAEASTLDPDSNKKALRDIAEQCIVAGRGERRSVTGKAIHSMFDLTDRKAPWKPPPQFAGLCKAYQDTLSVWGLVPEDIESPCVNDEFKLAGTLDRRYRTVSTLVAPDGTVVPIGSYVVADIKTGEELEYASGSYVCQLAAYVDSMRYNVTTDERSDWVPESLSDWALIIHARQTGSSVDVYWADINAGRIGLRLAHEVKEWRRRNDLLTIGNRQRIILVKPLPEEVTESEPVASTGVDASGPGNVSVSPVELSRGVARHGWLRGRVRALIEQSEVAGKALQMQWPQGVPGLKYEGHSWEQLDAIEEIVGEIERRYSIGFYPPFDDPAIEKSIESHPSNRWAKPENWARKPNPASDPYNEDSIGMHILAHRRSGLMRRWIAAAISGGIDANIDTTALAHALYEFGNLPEEDWPDDDLTQMLDGSLRAIGYVNGTSDLGRFNPADAPVLMSAAFAIAAGTAHLLFDENENPVVRTNVRKPNGKGNGNAG